MLLSVQTETTDAIAIIGLNLHDDTTGIQTNAIYLQHMMIVKRAPFLWNSAQPAVIQGISRLFQLILEVNDPWRERAIGFLNQTCPVTLPVFNGQEDDIKIPTATSHIRTKIMAD